VVRPAEIAINRSTGSGPVEGRDSTKTKQIVAQRPPRPRVCCSLTTNSRYSPLLTDFTPTSQKVADTADAGDAPIIFIVDPETRPRVPPHDQTAVGDSEEEE